MRGTYEAYILVKIKDGSLFVCALNRLIRRYEGQDDTLSTWDREKFQEDQVIWN